MAIVRRAKRDKNHTVVSNEILEDKNLNWDDLGVLVFLLSKPDDWSVNTKYLQLLRKSGRDAIRNSLNAIIEAGYMTKRPVPKHGWIYEISEVPIYKVAEDGISGRIVNTDSLQIVCQT